jgi:hypothetical protein
MSTKAIKTITTQDDLMYTIYDSDPVNPIAGQTYFNKVTNRPRIFNGYIWGTVGMAWDPSDSDK